MAPKIEVLTEKGAPVTATLQEGGNHPDGLPTTAFILTIPLTQTAIDEARANAERTATALAMLTDTEVDTEVFAGVAEEVAGLIGEPMMVDAPIFVCWN